nr:putative transmembrane protein [Aedes albopictus anphevirus]
MASMWFVCAVFIASLCLGCLYIMDALSTAGIHIHYTLGSVLYFLLPNISTLSVSAWVLYKALIFTLIILMSVLLYIISRMSKEMERTLRWAEGVFQKAKPALAMVATAKAKLKPSSSSPNMLP